MGGNSIILVAEAVWLVSMKQREGRRMRVNMWRKPETGQQPQAFYHIIASFFALLYDIEYMKIYPQRDVPVSTTTKPVTSAESITETFGAFMDAQKLVMQNLAKSSKDKREEDELKHKLVQIQMMPDGRQKQQMISELRKAVSQMGYRSVELQRICTDLNEIEHNTAAGPNGDSKARGDEGIETGEAK